MSTSLARRARALTFALACSTAALSSSSAFAADPAPADAETPSEADRLFEQGLAARKAGNLAEAEGFFRKAWALKKTWDIAANLGMVELNLGKLPEGANHVYYALTELPPTESKATRTKLFEAFRDARREVAGFDVRCDVDGAEVLVNGNPVGPTPLRRTQFAAPGQVTVEVRKDGYEAQRKTVTLEKSSNNTVAFTMVKAAPAGERSRVPAFVIGGVGVVGLAVGAGLIVGSRAELDKATALAEQIRAAGGTCKAGADHFDVRCADVEGAAIGSNAMKIGGTVGFAVAGAAAAGAALYWLWPSAKPVQGALRVLPAVAEKSGGVTITGSF